MSFRDPTALWSPYLEALCLTMSNKVDMLSSGWESSLSGYLAFLRGMVSPSTGAQPETSTVKGGFLVIRGSKIVAFREVAILISFERMSGLNGVVEAEGRRS